MSLSKKRAMMIVVIMNMMEMMLLPGGQCDNAIPMIPMMMATMM